MSFLRLNPDVIVAIDSISSVTRLAPRKNDDKFDLKVTLKTRGYAPNPNDSKQIVLLNSSYVLEGADAERMWEDMNKLLTVLA